MNETTENPGVPAGRPRSRTIGRIALEVFSIVLGVLLALAVSEWQEQRNNEARAQLALANVRTELQSNLDLLEIIYPNNSRVVESISSGESSGSKDATVVPGVQLRSSAWQTLASTGLSNYIDYDVLVGLSQLYAMIDVYRQTAYTFISANMSTSATATALGTSVDNDLFSQNFLAYFQMLVQIEATLIDAHRKAIDMTNLLQSDIQQ
jgi:hypothetical protein